MAHSDDAYPGPDDVGAKRFLLQGKRRQRRLRKPKSFRAGKRLRRFSGMRKFAFFQLPRREGKNRGKRLELLGLISKSQTTFDLFYPKGLLKYKSIVQSTKIYIKTN
jgi:hypothetical protein